MTAFKDVGNRAFSYSLVQIGFRFVFGHSAPHSDFDDRGAVAMLQNGATDRVVGESQGQGPNHRGHRGITGCLTPLDACFLRHLCWFSFGGGDSESVPAVIAAYSGVRRVQGAWPLSRLLVLDTARATVAITALVETESRA